MAIKIILLDFGVKQSIIDRLKSSGAQVDVVAGDTAVDEILDRNPNGILLSNGHGDPADNLTIIDNIRLLITTKIPMFGICLGHQMLAIALGAKTYKMPFGHHGANHPVQDLRNRKIYITSQNHNYAVLTDSLPSDVLITHKSLFDNTLQGFVHKNLPLMGFQGHPEAGPGPQDAYGLFNEFLDYAKAN